MNKQTADKLLTNWAIMLHAGTATESPEAQQEFAEAFEALTFYHADANGIDRNNAEAMGNIMTNLHQTMLNIGKMIDAQQAA